MIKNTEVLNNLTDRLGKKGAIELLTFSLPVLAERERELRGALLSGDWQTASRYAYRALGSVRLYGSERLEQLLVAVMNIQRITPADTRVLQQELSSELEEAMCSVKEWLISQDVYPESENSLPGVPNGAPKQPDRYCSFN